MRNLQVFCGIANGMSAKLCAAICGCCAVLLGAYHCSCAQTTLSCGLLPVRAHAPVAASTTHPEKAISEDPRRKMVGAFNGNPARKPIAANTAAQPATVRFSDGTLTVDADNSGLGQILQDLSARSGMTISGLNGGPRVFGIYGPGSFRDVLETLLVGVGYNYIMVGGATDGIPRELLLTSNIGNPVSFAPPNAGPIPSSEREDPEQPGFLLGHSVSGAASPGAISPAPLQEDQDEDRRTLQTMRRLQHIQQQEQNTPQ